VFEVSRRMDVEERGGRARIASVTAFNDLISGGEGDDVLIGDHASISAPFEVATAGAQPGAWTSRLDVKSLIRDFGHAAPVQKRLAVSTRHITNGAQAAASGEQGVDHIFGDAGNDVLFGARTDVLVGAGSEVPFGGPTDPPVHEPAGTNWLETDVRERNGRHLGEGGDFRGAPSIGKFLQSLANDPLALKTTPGKRALIDLRHD
jgi:Ca2+-binding RTX toxin-like protein